MTLSFPLLREVPDDVRVVGVPVFSGRVVPAGAGVELDGGWLAGRRFEANLGETVAVPADDGSTIVAVGLGDPAKLTVDGMRRAGAALVRAAGQDDTVATTLLAAAPVGGLDLQAAASALAEGASLAAYRFVRYKADSRGSRLERMVVVGSGRGVEAALRRGATAAAAVALARDLVNEPAGALTPSRLAEAATELASDAGLAVRVWDEDAITRERLGGLAGVARGSDEPPRLIRLEHTPPGTARARIALVGKGITFDSGGLSIKTAEGMETMKTDMSGAAAVLGAMSVVPELVPDVAVVGIVPASENMPGGRATKPGDVLRIRNGTTVEVLNTDAEGRLILADALSLAVEAQVDAIVDLATLTGACKIALGPKIAGLMGNHEEWTQQVRAAAERAGESVWPLPLPDEYRRSIDSDVADLKNVGSDRWGGALTAGLFLREFVGSLPWAHLDIAGPARSTEDEGYLRKGGTGWGVRTLLELLATCRPPAERQP